MRAARPVRHQLLLHVFTELLPSSDPGTRCFLVDTLGQSGNAHSTDESALNGERHSAADEIDLARHMRKAPRLRHILRFWGPHPEGERAESNARTVIWSERREIWPADLAFNISKEAAKRALSEALSDA